MEDNIKQHLHIVFGEEHFNPLGIIRSLGEYGINPIAILIKSNRPVASKSKYIQKTYLVDSIEEGYKILLKEYGNMPNKPFIYTSDDQTTSLLDKNYEELKTKFYFFNAGENNKVTRFMDKDEINKIANKYKLNIPQTWRVKRGEIPENIEFPIITKPIVPTIDNWKSDEIICNNIMELKTAYNDMQSSEILIQKYIHKKNELAIEGFSINGGANVFYAVGIDFNYMLKGKYSYYMKVKTFNNKSLQNKLNEVVNEIGFEGIFEIEFLIDKNDKLYFLEINFRPSAWNYSTSIAGMPLPILWAESMLNKSIKKEYHKEFEEFMAMSEPDDLRARVKTRQLSIFKWIKDLKKCKCLYYINRKDMKPFWSIIKVKFLKTKVNKNKKVK